MTRIPVIGILVSAVLEAGHVAHEVSNGKDLSKELTKSAVSLTVTTAAIAGLGALGSATLGPVGSVLGVAGGAIIGNITDKVMEEAF